MTYRCPDCDIPEVELQEDGTVARHSLHIVDKGTGHVDTYRTLCLATGWLPEEVPE